MKELQKKIHANAISKGWWENPPTFGELISLCHCELSEALEEYRNGKKPNETYYVGKDEFGVRDIFFETNPNGDRKPEGIPTELADTVIRIMDLCEHYGIDLESAITEKMKYNTTRKYRHGGKKL